MQPFVSVIIPTYNRATILPRAINSVLNQSYSHFELLVVDDGSADNTATVVSNFLDNRIIYVYQRNSGVCAARNKGASEASGEYLIFLDSDDYLLKDCLTIFAQAIGEFKSDVIKAGSRMTKGSDKISYSFLPGGFAIRKSIFFEVGGYDEALKFGENTELMWRLKAHGAKVVCLNDVVRIYDNSTEDGGGKNIRNMVEYFYHITQKHSKLFGEDPLLAQQQYHVAAVNCYRLGRYPESRSLFWKGYKLRPYSGKALARALVYTGKMIFQ